METRKISWINGRAYFEMPPEKMGEYGDSALVATGFRSGVYITPERSFLWTISQLGCLEPGERKLKRYFYAFSGKAETEQGRIIIPQNVLKRYAESLGIPVNAVSEVPVDFM